MSSLKRELSIEADVVNVTGLSTPNVTYTTNSHKWQSLVKSKALIAAASPENAQPVASNIGQVTEGGVPCIVRNAEPLKITKTGNIMKVDDEGILATFSVVISAKKDRRLLEAISPDQSVEVIIIQEVRGVYIARYYDTTGSGDKGFNIRTEFIKDTGVIDRVLPAKDDTPAYDKYCRKLCSVRQLLGGKKLTATLRFYDHPSDSATLSCTWQEEIITQAQRIVGSDKVKDISGHETKLSAFEKYVPFRTWLVIKDPVNGELYPKFCFDWVSQFKVAAVNGEYISSLICPPENVDASNPSLRQNFEVFTCEGDPRQSHPALVRQDDLPDVPPGLVENCEEVADKCTSPVIYYGNQPVHGAKYKGQPLALVSGDWAEIEDTGCLEVVEEVWEEEDD